jgi:hypothetical protein
MSDLQGQRVWRDYFRSENEDLHVMPDDNKHASSPDCFCVPELNYTDEITKKSVWVHKSPEELNQ